MNLRAGQDGLVKALTGPVVGLFAAPVLLGAVLTLLDVGPVIELTSATLAFGAVSVFHTLRARRLNRTLSAPAETDLNSVDLASVTTLIATANVDNGAGQAVGTLISKMPNLREVHVIVGHSDVAQQATFVAALGDYARLMGRNLRIGGQPLTIAPLQVTDDDQVALRRYLGGFVGSESSWVDITGGTVAMSVAVNRAAAALGLNVCYTATNMKATPPVFYGVVDLAH